MASVVAGATAAVGLIEFNWGGPPYDGGFAGDLMFFGGFLALGQAPFVAAILWCVFGEAGAGRGLRYAVALWTGVLWPVAGFVGWTLGSYLEVGISAPLYAATRSLAGVVPWTAIGVGQAGIVGIALAVAPRASTRGRGGRWTVVFAGVAAWTAASVLGGMCYEFWAALDVAARQNHLNDAIGRFLEGLGAAENVAYVVVPHVLFLPLLYGIPTGFALIVIRGVLLRC